ncbi:lysozyme [Gibbsiella quercinecans]|uniref:lysozyme n=1 Tax=Gibbsiella quercinecans TaxID=929813 RepID=UPI0024311C24|nr:lysozyme [Gibbsiella quercinecans]
MNPTQIKTTLTGVLAVAALLLSQLEGTRYDVYTDVAGVPTVCEGITGTDVVRGKRYTRRECDVLLQKHIRVAQTEVDNDIKVDVPVTFRAAMYSFTFNAGRTAYRNSKMLALTNQGKLSLACDQLHRWVYVTNPRTKKKVISSGLKNRRAAEYEMCMRDL